MGVNGSTLYEDGSLYVDVGTSADSGSIATLFFGFIIGSIRLDVATGNLDTNMTYCKTVAPHSARTNSGSTYPSALRVISAARSHVSAEYVNEPINSEFFNFIDYLDAARTNSGSARIAGIPTMGDYVTRFYDHCSKPGVGVSYESISADSRSSRNIAFATHFEGTFCIGGSNYQCCADGNVDPCIFGTADYGVGTVQNELHCSGED